jgi:hypothetical protein
VVSGGRASAVAATTVGCVAGRRLPGDSDDGVRGSSGVPVGNPAPGTRPGAVPRVVRVSTASGVGPGEFGRAQPDPRTRAVRMGIMSAKDRAGRPARHEWSMVPSWSRLAAVALLPAYFTWTA